MGAGWTPFSDQNRSKNRFQELFNSHCFFVRFFIAFGTVLASKSDPKNEPKHSVDKNINLDTFEILSKMIKMLRSAKPCKPSHTSFNSQKKYAFRSSVVTAMCSTLERNPYLFGTLAILPRQQTHPFRPRPLSATDF